MSLLPVFLSYVLSFVYLGIYWNDHHYMLHATQRVTGGLYVFVALMWLVPDRRIECILGEQEK